MKRRYDMDLMRALCMIGVVYLHSASGSFYQLDCRSLWLFSNLVNVFAVLAVPLFFMMSGALLLSRDSTDDPRTVVCRRLPRLLVPLLFWSAMVLLRTARVQGVDAALGGLKVILSTPANVAYWYLYALIPMYLLAPLLKAMTDHLDRRRWRYLFLVWFVLTLGLSTLRSFLPAEWQASFTEHPTLNLNAVAGYLGYFLLGAYLDRMEKLPSRRTLVLGTAAAAIFVAVATYVDTYARGECSSRFTGYSGIFTALRAAGLFLLFKSLLGEKEERTRLLPLLSGCSFGVYLAHPLVIFWLGGVWYARTGLYGQYTIPQQLVFSGGVFLTVFALTLVLASVPGLSYLCTGQRFKTACQSSNLFALFRRKRPGSPGKSTTNHLDNGGKGD